MPTIPTPMLSAITNSTINQAALTDFNTTHGTSLTLAQLRDFVELHLQGLSDEQDNAMEIQRILESNMQNMAREILRLEELQTNLAPSAKAALVAAYKNAVWELVDNSFGLLIDPFPEDRPE